MNPPETGDRRSGLKGQLLERLHDPIQLRVLVVAVLLGIGYGAVYTPLDTQVAAMNAKLKKEWKLADLADKIEKLQSQCKGFEKRLPQQTDTKEWMQYMLDGIHQFPLTLTKFDCLAPRQAGPYQVIVLKIEVEGSYYELDNLLRWLEQNARLLRVDNIDIAPTKAKEKANKDVMKMELTILGLGA